MRLKDVVRLKNSRSVDNNEGYIGLENIVSWDAKFIPSDIESDGDSNAFKKNDILYSKLRPYLAKGFLADSDGSCSTEFFVLQTNEQYNNRFLLYFLLSHNVVDYINSRVTGVKMPRTKWQDIAALELPDFSIEIQSKVADYLDNKTEEIDRKIELLIKQREAYERLKKAMINRLVTRGLDSDVQLRDSGLPYIGQIPCNWEIKRIKDLCTYVSRGNTPEYVYESPFKVMNQATFSKGYIDDTLIRFTASSNNDAHIKYRDLLMASTGGGILGKLLYFDSSDTNFYADSHVTILRNSKNPLVTKFLFFYFSIRYEEINQTLVKGSTNQTELQRNYLLSYELPLPSSDELPSIVGYLEENISASNAKIDNINKRIDAYNRLKRSLIDEVVTGKRNI